MKINNLKVTATALTLGGCILLGASAFHHYDEEVDQELIDIEMNLDEIKDDISEIRNDIDDLSEMIMMHHDYLEQVNKIENVQEQEKTVEQEVEELLEESPEYRKIAEYVSEITEEDVDAYVKEVLDSYGITSKSNTFRFDPNNFYEANSRIQEYAEKMDSEENMTYETEYHINATEEDYLVREYRERYQVTHPEASEEELKAVEKEFREKAAAVYYTKMNLKYLNDTTLKKINETYHFVDDSENLIDEIKAYADSAIILYRNNPLMKNMVANSGDYLAHSLLDENVNNWHYLIGFDEEKIATRVIHGDYGNGEERKENLGREGYNYYTVQAKVNQMMGLVPRQSSVFYRMENGEVVSNLPMLPTDQEELYKYLLIELKYQSQHYGFYGPESYDPGDFLIRQVIFGHYNQVYDMLYRTEEITDDMEKAILKELDYHRYAGDAIKFFETVEKVPEVTGNSQKTYK